MNNSIFFTQIRTSLFKKLTTLQVEGMEAIIDYWQTKDLYDNRKIAYILATVYHETAATMQPIEEYGKGRNKPYGKRLKMSRKPYADTENIFYGRGFVQLTWYENYEKAGKLLNRDLISEPELMLEVKYSAQVAIEGMLSGMFTGKKLSDYFNSRQTAPVQARRIINGTDKADKITNYYKLFLAAIEKAND